MSDLMEFEDLKSVCRVCLIKSKKLISLNDYLCEDDPDSTAEGPLISDVLSDIVCTEIKDDYPYVICPECLHHVKLAYNLKCRFEESQQILQNYRDSVIVESYMQNENFEVYESDDCFETACESDNKSTEKESFITEGIDLTDSSCDTDVKEKETQIIETFPDVAIEESGVKKPLKIIKLNVCDKNRSKIQVRCVDLNKFIIERKDNDDVLSGTSEVLDQNSNSKNENAIVKIKLERSDCPSCGETFSKWKYNRHVKYCKSLKKSSLTCKQCDKVFKKIKDLNFHIKLKHSLNPPVFPCKICNVLCANYSARQVHMRRMHGGEKPFVCETCGKSFFYRAGLLKHNSKHTRETQEICNICGKCFHYKGALFYHIKMHTNERKYLCSFCEKSFYTSQSLQRHLDTHTGVRRFKCKFCDKSFRSTSERRRHEMIHTGERPYECDYCDKKFTSKYNQDVHTAGHRGQHPCDICNKKYLNTEVLELHLKLKHKVKLKKFDT